MDPDRLKDVPLFQSLSKRERQRVAQCADEVDVAAGKHLVDEGQWAHEFFVVERGTAEVTVHGERVGELGPGDFFGELGVFAEDRVRKASVMATAPMELIVLTAASFRQLERDLPRVAEQIRGKLQERLSVLH